MVQSRMSITWLELHAELLVFDKRLEMQTNLKNNSSFSGGISVNMANSKDVGNQRGQENFSNNRQNYSGRGGQRR